MIGMSEITRENYKEVLGIRVLENQKEHVLDTSVCLATAYAYRDSIYPFAILNDDEIVGFIMTRFNPEYNNYFIWQFMIDFKHQKKGLGRLALIEHLQWIQDKSPNTDIVTTVIEGNHYVENLYKDIGFKQMGETMHGETDFILKRSK
jgi:diamine N-acetyltransferase